MTPALGWRLRTEHVTTFRYPRPARASYNEVRQLPRTTARQTVLESRVLTAPHTSHYTYRDYFGTNVVAFNVDGLHDHLEIRSTTLVATQEAVEPPAAGWAEVAAATDRHAELLAPSPHTRPSAAIAAAAAEVRRASPVATVRAAADWVHGTLRYLPGVTGVRTSAAEALEAGSGVCQDFAHLALAVLRTTGLPARYVSGYLHPDPDAAVGEEARGESHAWIEAWVGDWWGLDPTNDVPIGPRHVVVAHGRDYADVPPVRGVYAGEVEHDTEVSVTVLRTQ